MQFLSSIPMLAWLAPIIMLWGQIRGFFGQLFRLLVVQVRVEGESALALTSYLSATYKALPTNVSRYTTSFHYILKEKTIRALLLAMNRGLKNQLFWVEGTLVSLTDKSGTDKESGFMVASEFQISFLRGTLDHESLLLAANNWWHTRNIQPSTKSYPRFSIRRIKGHAQQSYALKTSEAPGLPTSGYETVHHNRILGYTLDDIGYSRRDFFYAYNEKGRQFKADVERWVKSKDWYESKGLLHRRGSLLLSEPGQGKSSLIRKVAQELDLPVTIFELATLDDTEMIDNWERCSGAGPRFVVFEDIDCVFKGRENIAKGGKLSFECLLNCVSGVQPSEGIYLVITTNRIDYLDSALGIPSEIGSTRPGRLDLCLELTGMDTSQKEAIAMHFLADRPEVAKELISDETVCTAAQFTDKCSQKALELYWRNEK